MKSLVHLVATSNRPTTVCCDRSPFELPDTDRITITPALRTCRGARA